MGEQRTVLVVDDEADVRDLVIEILAEASVRSIAANGGTEALAALETDPSIGLLFTDVAMPDIDGFMLADMAKTRWPALMVIYTTGFQEVARSLPGIMHGPMLQKPLLASTVLEAIEAAFAGAARAS